MSVAESSPLGLILEPTIVFTILGAGVYFNRIRSPVYPPKDPHPQLQYRERRLFGYKVSTRDTSVWRTTTLSRLLFRYPFMIEVCYWVLTYLVYQGARGVTALTFTESTTDLARENGMWILEVENILGMDTEREFQRFFLDRPFWIGVLNRVYSFVHIPATVGFFGYMYYQTSSATFTGIRRTMALCNLYAFFVFTTWPAMPPRLLPEEYGYIDTVHSTRVASVWTTNAFCNQLAAMPSLHFGYAFIVGTSMLVHAHWKPLRIIGALYAPLILIAIVATANHYFLDAIAGLFVAILAYFTNSVLLNLLVIEDYILYVLRIEKPPTKEEVQFMNRGTEYESEESMKVWYERV
ncbi:hypothetical protein SpCBS45565_g07763 [Spizellomyces sp. 'palustris']|nr:hypothetical protein SpCBS45565_g07763 [Spizellomyces sp. 'palustris']